MNPCDDLHFSTCKHFSQGLLASILAPMASNCSQNVF
ncbi:hypothetical protein LINPERHAP1_LOCUS14071 [Linum perenne]